MEAVAGARRWQRHTGRPPPPCPPIERACEAARRDRPTLGLLHIVWADYAKGPEVSDTALHRAARNCRRQRGCAPPCAVPLAQNSKGRVVREDRGPDGAVCRRTYARD